MKLLLLKLFGLSFIFTIIFGKLSLKKASENLSKSRIRNKKVSNKNKIQSKMLPDDITYGYATSDNILQNAAVFL